MAAKQRSICWTPLWNNDVRGAGLEHLLLSECTADSQILAIDEERGPFRLAYRLQWDERWRLLEAQLETATERDLRSLRLKADGQGHWRGNDDEPLTKLEGCIDIDIWPTPFTNSFPILRQPLAIGERRQFLMAWVFAPDLTINPVPQAYTRLADRRYRFENLDGSSFKAELTVDADGLVLDYPDFFQRVPAR